MLLLMESWSVHNCLCSGLNMGDWHVQVYLDTKKAEKRVREARHPVGGPCSEIPATSNGHNIQRNSSGLFLLCSFPSRGDC